MNHSFPARASLVGIRRGARIREQQAGDAAGRAPENAERDVAAHGYAAEDGAIDLEMRKQRDNVVRVVVHRQSGQARVLEGRARAAKPAQVRSDEPPAGRHSMDLRQPLVRAQWKCVQQDERPAGSGFDVPERPMRKVRNLAFHCTDCIGVGRRRVAAHAIIWIMKVSRVPVVLLALSLSVAGCTLKDDEPPPPGSGPPPIPAPADVAAPPADALKTPSGIASKVLIVGLGTIHPKPNSKVTVHYTGWSADGKMFDSSYQRGQPAQFGLNEVIPGWTEAVQLMVVGEKRRFWIPGKLAYDGQPGNPQGQLCFEIELMDIR